MNKDYIYGVITDYIDGKTNDFSLIKMIGSKRKIHIVLDKYASIYPNKKSEIDDIISNLDELYKTHKKIPMYVHTIDEYLNGNIDFRHVRLLGTRKNVIILLEKYKEYNPNKAKEIDNIINNIDVYFETSKIISKHIKAISLYLDNKIDFKELKNYFPSKKLMIENLNKYKEKYPNRSREIDDLLTNLDYYILKSKDIKYIVTITKYINGEISFDEIMNLGSISYIKLCLNKYLELYPLKEDDIEEMFIKLDTYYKDDIKIINPDLIITRYINGFITNDEINRLFTKEKFLNYLKKYIIKHSESKEYVISIINNIDNIYQLRGECSMKETMENIKPIYNKKTSEKELIDDLFYSSLSIEEYCSKTGTSIKKIKKLCINYSKSNDKDKVNMGNILLERSSFEFLTKLKNDVLITLTKDDADIFDYFGITRLSGKEFRETMTGLIPHEMLVEILRRIDLYRIDPSNNLHSIVNKDAKMNCKIVIGGREITKEEKEKVLKFLESNNYPLCLFNSALKKYVSGKLEITEKVLVKE